PRARGSGSTSFAAPHRSEKSCSSLCRRARPSPDPGGTMSDPPQQEGAPAAAGLRIKCPQRNDSLDQNGYVTGGYSAGFGSFPVTVNVKFDGTAPYSTGPQAVDSPWRIQINVPKTGSAQLGAVLKDSLGTTLTADGPYSITVVASGGCDCQPLSSG